MKKRTGAPTSGTVAADGTDNNPLLPRIILFEKPVSPCIVTNHGATDEIWVKVNTELNGTVSETFTAANGLGHFVIPPKVTLADAAKDPPEGGECYCDVSCGGQISVHSVSIVTVTGDLDDISCVGWCD